MSPNQSPTSIAQQQQQPPPVPESSSQPTPSFVDFQSYSAMLSQPLPPTAPSGTPTMSTLSDPAVSLDKNVSHSSSDPHFQGMLPTANPVSFNHTAKMVIPTTSSNNFGLIDLHHHHTNTANPHYPYQHNPQQSHYVSHPSHHHPHHPQQPHYAHYPSTSSSSNPHHYRSFSDQLRSAHDILSFSASPFPSVPASTMASVSSTPIASPINSPRLLSTPTLVSNYATNGHVHPLEHSIHDHPHHHTSHLEKPKRRATTSDPKATTTLKSIAAAAAAAGFNPPSGMQSAISAMMRNNRIHGPVSPSGQSLLSSDVLDPQQSVANKMRLDMQFANNGRMDDSQQMLTNMAAHPQQPLGHPFFNYTAHASQMDDHVSGSKRYICPHPGCNRVFPRQYNLKSHMLCHTGVKPHACDLCKASFARKHDLQRHIRTLHSGTRPHQCPVCKQGFNRLDTLRKHLKSDEKQNLDLPEIRHLLAMIDQARMEEEIIKKQKLEEETMMVTSLIPPAPLSDDKMHHHHPAIVHHAATSNMPEVHATLLTPGSNEPTPQLVNLKAEEDDEHEGNWSTTYQAE